MQQVSKKGKGDGEKRELSKTLTDTINHARAPLQTLLFLCGCMVRTNVREEIQSLSLAYCQQELASGVKQK